MENLGKSWKIGPGATDQRSGGNIRGEGATAVVKADERARAMAMTRRERVFPAGIALFAAMCCLLASGATGNGVRVALVAWGLNNAGQLGLGHTSDVHKPEFVPTFYPKRVRGLAAGGSEEGEDGEGGFSLILTSEDTVYAFGCNEYGQLGVGDNEERRSMVPLALSRREKIAKVAAGGSFAVVLTEKGRVYTWGRNNAGQLGQGDFRDRNAPAIVSAGGLEKVTVADVAAGSDFVVALTRSGQIWCWGSNERGQLGQGDMGGFSNFPREVKAGSLRGVKFSKLAAGSTHCLALSRTGEVYTWGGNAQGQLGLGDLEDRGLPMAIMHRFSRSRVDAVAAGAEHSVALTEKGEVFTFGSNRCGLLGHGGRGGGEEAVSLPRLVDAVKGVRVQAGARATAVGVRSGKAFVWGCNDRGQLGLGDLEPRATPTLLPASKKSPLVHFAIGAAHVLAASEAGDLLAWGRNVDAELGLAYSSTGELKPALVASNSSSAITQICTGGHAYEQQGHAVCRTESGSVFSWGWNAFGQLGLGSITKHVSAPARLHDLEGPKVARLLSCGQYNTAAYVERSRMGPYTWGPNYSGQLGHNYLRLGPITRPTRLDQFKTTAFAQIRLGYNHALGLTERGDLYVWGSNMHGQLGLGDTKDRTKPSRLTLPGGGRVRSIAAGAFSSFASTEDNVTYAWGYNENGELGLGEGYDRNSPQRLKELAGKAVTRLVCGAYHTFAVEDGGKVHGWGSNEHGQLGLGHTRGIAAPTLVEGAPRPMKVLGKFGLETFAAGNSHTVLVSENGTVYSWGRNDHGQLGVGKEWVTVTTPMALEGVRARGVVAAASHNLAVAEVPDGGAGGI